jgi:NADPH:quinone reductase-like Zn-dependent oxidoreductase
VVDRVFSFEDAPRALRYLAEGKHFGKVCITMD